jgi:hypothetical protein
VIGENIKQENIVVAQRYGKNKIMFEKLKETFEGKTILEVLPADTIECMCRFVFSDGSAIRLFANDLGYWVEATLAKPDDNYLSLNSLMVDYGHHIYHLMPRYNFDLPDAIIAISNNIIEVMAPDERIFKGDISYFSDKEKLILSNKDAIKMLASSAAMGDMWKSYFIQQNNSLNLPKELLFD